MTSGNVTYGKKWIRHMKETLSSTEETDWTETALEAAFLKANLHAAGSECTWTLGTKPNKAGG